MRQHQTFQASQAPRASPALPDSSPGEGLSFAPTLDPALPLLSCWICSLALRTLLPLSWWESTFEVRWSPTPRPRPESLGAEVPPACQHAPCSLPPPHCVPTVKAGATRQGARSAHRAPRVLRGWKGSPGLCGYRFLRAERTNLPNTPAPGASESERAPASRSELTVPIPDYVEALTSQVRSQPDVGGRGWHLWACENVERSLGLGHREVRREPGRGPEPPPQKNLSRKIRDLTYPV